MMLHLTFEKVLLKISQVVNSKGTTAIEPAANNIQTHNTQITRLG